MRLSGYMSAPNKPIFDALDQYMDYIPENLSMTHNPNWNFNMVMNMQNTSTLHTNGVATHWDISKQAEPTGTTRSAELVALHKGIIKVNDIQHLSSSISYAIGEPSTVYKNNVGTIKTINADQITPTLRHHNAKISSVIYHSQKGIIAVTHFKSDLMLADPNTKSHGGKTLRMEIDRLIGTKFYPPEGSVHHDLLFKAPEVSIEQLQQTSK
eukprot:9422322-Ditylum_brightwellii.AAC.1